MHGWQFQNKILQFINDSDTFKIFMPFPIIHTIKISVEKLLNFYIYIFLKDFPNQ